MACIICGLNTGDACVLLCALHMPLAALAGQVESGEISDWPQPFDPDATPVSHSEMMCDTMCPCMECGTLAWGDLCEPCAARLVTENPGYDF